MKKGITLRDYSTYSQEKLIRKYVLGDPSIFLQMQQTKQQYLTVKLINVKEKLMKITQNPFGIQNEQSQILELLPNYLF